MFKSLLSKLFGGPASFVEGVEPPGGGGNEKNKTASLLDPLDPIVRQREPFKEQSFQFMELRQASEFAVFDGLAGDKPTTAAVGDGKLMEGKTAAMDDGEGAAGTIKGQRQGFMGLSEALGMWYMSQGFFGYQACAMIAQNWLVDKACSMAGEDAARNGWYISSQGGEDLPKEQYDLLLKEDKKIKIKENIVEFNRFKNVFGIRVAIFKVESDDDLYYEKPFNIDGVKKGSYKGISQVDPYWMTPVLSSHGMQDPSTIGFYEPQYWVINGKKYHISHLAITRGPAPADILKPTYLFGGIPLVQRIYERVYAAERTANEAPLMAMSKRTMAIHADIDKILANQCEFEERLAVWIRYRDNHGIKVLGTEETMEQFDTSMTDFDAIIMNQYQIVAAIARVPSTKLLGTSPKGFNATGEFESKSYHEELESIQEHVMMPMLERHYELSARSLGFNVELTISFHPVDSVTTKERADLNKLKADTGIELINAGVISPDEERDRLQDDQHSGYDRLADHVTAEEEPGMSPENLASLQKAGAAETTAQKPDAAPAMPGEADTLEPSSGASPETLQALLPLLLKGVSTGGKSADPAMAALLLLMGKLLGGQPTPDTTFVIPSTKGSTKGSTKRSINEIDVMDIGDGQIIRNMPIQKMPKLRLHGLNLVIENPRGTVRCGVDLAGDEWASEMPDHYGFIQGYEGADGQDVDCFIGPNLLSKYVFVIVQKCLETGEFDEYKCMIGYDSPEDAMAVYASAYSDSWTGFDSMLPPMTIEEFKDWLTAGGGSAGIPTVEEEFEPLPLDMMDEDFKETDHPRDKGGQFTSGAGGALAKTAKPATKPGAKPTAKPAKSTQVTPLAKQPGKGTASTASSNPKAAKLKSGGMKSLSKLPDDRAKWPPHIKALNLPPAWKDVHAAADPKAYLQAIGHDEKGRPQSVYTAEWKEAKAAEKFGRVKGMNEEFNQMSDKIKIDRGSENAKTRNTADAMSVVVSMGIRPGSDDDTGAEKKAHGASNLEARHVKVAEDGSVTLEFVGKKGVDLKLPVSNPEIASMLKERKAAAGSDDGRLFPGVSDKSLLQYSHTLDGGDFKTKDFRTFAGTSAAIDHVKTIPAPTTEKEYKLAVREVAKRVSSLLGNTPVVALQSYIDPSVFSQWRANLK